jgi:hypothetical protein
VRLLAALVLLLAALPAAGDGPPPAARRPDVNVILPVDPYEHERLHWFGRRGHHLVPGTVTIDREPYRCDVDRRRFRKEDDFVAHLRTVHRLPEERIPDALVVRDGIVHFIGAPTREGRGQTADPQP